MPSSTAAEYFARANGRLEWALWGKARALSDSDSPAHPLLCHMVDVASVAERLLEGILPPSTVARLTTPLGLGGGKIAVHWLLFFVALHDLGKATPAFVAKWSDSIEPLQGLGFDVKPAPGDRDHGTCGVALVEDALAKQHVDAELALRIGRAVAAHHGSFPSNFAAFPQIPRNDIGRSPVWIAARARVCAELRALFGIEGSTLPDPASATDWAFLSALAGFVSVADWVGSMAEIFTYETPPADLPSYAERARRRAERALAYAGFHVAKRPAVQSFSDVFGFPPWPMHEAAEALASTLTPPFCLVIEAPMGEGKTEAALYTAQTLAARGAHDGVYIGLPTQATANQMFNRLRAFLEKTRPDQRTNLQLVHGEAIFDARVRDLLRGVYDPVHGETSAVACESWFLEKKRSLLAPFGAGTIDQALLSVLRTKHAFVRQLGLAGKTVILDEVHAYDTYTSTLLDRLVSWLGALGASVVILSATLPRRRREALLAAYSGTPHVAKDEVPYPRITAAAGARIDTVRLRSRRTETTLLLEWVNESPPAGLNRLSAQLRDGGCAGWICNTVRRAQDAYALAREARTTGLLPEDTELFLVHARFPQEERSARERGLVDRLGPKGCRPERLLVIGTQVLEQSLDVDFDLLLTDVAPTDLVLQRAGRLHRHTRPRRPRGAEQPTMIVAAPPGDPLEASLERVGGVYEPFVLRRSLRLLRTRARVVLPTDIEHLVEATYDDAPDSSDASSDRLVAERAKFFQTRTDEEIQAKHRLWPGPRVPDDPFGDLLMPFDEDEDAAAALRAITRLGGPSVEIACLFGSSDEAFLDREGTRPLDLRREPTSRTVADIAQRSLRIATPGLVQTLQVQPVPTCWRDCAPLSRRRLVFFGEEPTNIGVFTLRLDAELGLVIVREDRRTDAV